MDKWWAPTKLKAKLELQPLCECKLDQKGRWLIVDQETLERAYICEKCRCRIYPKAQ